MGVGVEGWAGLCLQTEPLLGRVISAGDAGPGPQLSSDPRSQKVIVRWLPGPPHRLFCFFWPTHPHCCFWDLNACSLGLNSGTRSFERGQQ